VINIEATFNRGPPPPPPPPPCHTIYETIYEQHCEVSYTQHCNTVVETAIQTHYEKQCAPVGLHKRSKTTLQLKNFNLKVVQRECHPTVRVVPDRECNILQEQQCVDEEQTTYDVTYQQQCENVPSQARNFL